MIVLMMGVGVLALIVVMVMIVIFSAGLGRQTCRECGGGLPVIRLSKESEGSYSDDWACPKCGTRFDRQARARNQLRT